MWHLQRSLRSSADVWNRMTRWLVFPWFVQSLKYDHWNNLPALFELTEKDYQSILSLGLTTSAWPPSTKKSKELQETEDGYSGSKPSVTAGEGKVNKPLLSFTEMLSSQGTDCSTCLREVDYDPFMPSHVKTNGPLTDDIFQSIAMLRATPQIWLFCPRKMMKLLRAGLICKTILELCQL